MEAEVSGRGEVARVRAMSVDRRTLHIDFRNGQTATIDLPEPTDIELGTVLRVYPDEDRFDVAPADIWPEVLEVGVIKLALDQTTFIVDVSGRLRKLPAADGGTAYTVGNTVEVSELKGIVSRLADEPVKYLDFQSVDDATIRGFKTERASNLTFDDFGGLPDVVERARELIKLSLEKRADLARIGARPIKGVLFTGPPGTGKTLLARIIAAQSGAMFYEVSGPEIFSKWYGQSEELLRKIFEDAARQPRSIIFFDEIDSVAARRDEEAHEASKRVVAQLLTLMDGFTAEENVLVIAATNRPQDIDNAMLRPGRFDWQIDFPLPTVSDRLAILRQSSRTLRTDDPLPHEFVATQTEGWSAAALAAIWTEAALLAVDDDRDIIMVEDYLGGMDRVGAHPRIAIYEPKTPSGHL